jgi:hypothetical protein
MLKQVMWIAAAAAILGVCGVGAAEEKARAKSKVRQGKSGKPVALETMLSKSTLAKLSESARDIEVGGGSAKGISDDAALMTALDGLGLDPVEEDGGQSFGVRINDVYMSVDYLPDFKLVRAYIRTYPLKDTENTPSGKVLKLMEQNSPFATWVYLSESEDFLAFTLLEGKLASASALRARLEAISNLWISSGPYLDILDWPAE